MITNEWATAGAGALAICLAVLAWRIREAIIVRRSARMETYLRLEREAGADCGRRSIKQLMAKLGMTERQVLDASKRSPAIRRLPITASFAGSVFDDSAMFEYAPFGTPSRNAI
jgi:hypothetical protein